MNLAKKTIEYLVVGSAAAVVTAAAMSYAQPDNEYRVVTVKGVECLEDRQGAHRPIETIDGIPTVNTIDEHIVLMNHRPREAYRLIKNQLELYEEALK